MSRTIVIDPVTRLEGHAKITLKTNGAGGVEEAYFHVTQVRGFEKFCVRSTRCHRSWRVFAASVRSAISSHRPRRVKRSRRW